MCMYIQYCVCIMRMYIYTVGVNSNRFVYVSDIYIYVYVCTVYTVGICASVYKMCIVFNVYVCELCKCVYTVCMVHIYIIGDCWNISIVRYCIFTCICAAGLRVTFLHLINQIQSKNSHPVKSSFFFFLPIQGFLP